MSKRAFDKIRAGLEDAIAIARGEADPATYRPEGAARAFLKVIDREPDAVRRALAA